MSDMNRRDFLATAAAATCAACAFPCGGLAFAADAPPVGPVDVGALADFAKDGPVDKFACWSSATRVGSSPPRPPARTRRRF
jgi:hypothetical protein